MNELTSITGKGPITMSSREIAELTGKQHKHVMRDIKAMLAQLDEPEEGYAQTWTNPQNGQTYPEYRLDRDLTETLLLGYSAPLRRKVLARLRELEGIVANPAALLNDPAAMRGILLSYTEKVLALEAKIETDKPKTQFYDAYLNADGLYGLQNAARALNCRPNLFIRWLKEHYLFYQGGNLVARIQQIQMGNFEVKTTLVDDKVRPQAFITPKGLKYLDVRAPEHIRVAAA